MGVSACVLLGELCNSDSARQQGRRYDRNVPGSCVWAHSHALASDPSDGFTGLRTDRLRGSSANPNSSMTSACADDSCTLVLQHGHVADSQLSPRYNQSFSQFGQTTFALLMVSVGGNAFVTFRVRPQSDRYIKCFGYLIM